MILQICLEFPLREIMLGFFNSMFLNENIHDLPLEWDLSADNLGWQGSSLL